MGHRGIITKIKNAAIIVAILTVAIIVVVNFLTKHDTTALQDEATDMSIAQDEAVQYPSGDFIYSPTDESIAFDETEYVVFYDDLLIVYLESEISDAEATGIAEAVDGVVVGRLSGDMNLLQIKVASTELQKLEDMATTIMGFEDVIYAMYDTPVILSNEAADGNPWSGNGTLIEDKGNEESASGNDWWAEAIGAYTAWDFVDQHEDALHEITVGILDDGFDTDHEDLSGKICFLVNYRENTASDHGTHVAGIIGAVDNDVGIRGIANRAQLIGVDWSPATNDKESAEYVSLLSTGEYAKIIKNLIENDAKVINCSWGSYWSSWDAFLNKFTDSVLDNPSSREKAQTDSVFDKPSSSEKAWEVYRQNSVNTCVNIMLQLFLNDKTDFLIVQSAGNGYDNTGMIGYDASLTADFCALTEDAFLKIEQYYSAGIITRNWMEKVDFTYENFKNHILVVGSVKNKQDKNGNYKMASGSNYGDVVDICAPGEGIYSTLVGNQYGTLSGTSMAAPMVSGAAALIWSIAPELSAAEVKQALCTNIQTYAVGVGGDAGTLYPMLNVGVAVQAVTSNEVSDDTNNSAEISISPDEATAIWEDFLIAGDYSTFTAGWSETSLEYTIADLNADAIPELLIQSSVDAPFYNTWLFVLDNTDIVLSSETYGYGSFRYSPSNNAVIGSPEWRPFSGTGYSPFYSLCGTQLEYIFQIGQDEGQSYYSDSTGVKSIGDEERSAYYTDVINFEWKQIQSLNDYAQPAEFEGQLIGVLNKIVDSWTDGTTEYQIYADERFAHNIVSISNGEVRYRTNIENGTVEVTGDESANLAPDTQAGSLQTWQELKYDPTTDTIYIGNITHPYYRMGDWISGNTPDVTYNEPDDGTSDSDASAEKTYGDNITWAISDGVLRATGVGNMNDYASTAYIPWYENRKDVTTVIMEGTITSVGDYAFDGFSNMTSITLPDTIRRIGEFAFWMCGDLSEIVIPDGCTVIENNAFNWCESLDSITLPATITEIQWNAFAKCENLSDIYYAGTAQQWNAITISSLGNEDLLTATVHYNSTGPDN